MDVVASPLRIGTLAPSRSFAPRPQSRAVFLPNANDRVGDQCQITTQFIRHIHTFTQTPHPTRARRTRTHGVLMASLCFRRPRGETYYTYDMETKVSGYRDVLEHAEERYVKGDVASRPGPRKDPSIQGSSNLWNNRMRGVLAVLKTHRYASHIVDDVETRLANKEYTSTNRASTDMVRLCASACGHCRVPNDALKRVTRHAVITMYEEEVENLKSFGKYLDSYVAEMGRFAATSFEFSRYMCRVHERVASRSVDPSNAVALARHLVCSRDAFTKWFPTAPTVMDWVASVSPSHHVTNPITFEVLPLHPDATHIGDLPTLSVFLHWMQCHQWSIALGWENPVEDEEFASTRLLVDRYVTFFARDMATRHLLVEDEVLGSLVMVDQLLDNFGEGCHSLVSSIAFVDTCSPLIHVATSLEVNERGIVSMFSTLGARLAKTYSMMRMVISLIHRRDENLKMLVCVQEETWRHKLLSHEELNTLAVYVNKLAGSRRASDAEELNEVKRLILEETCDDTQIEVESLSLLVQNKILAMATARKQHALWKRRVRARERGYPKRQKCSK